MSPHFGALPPGVHAIQASGRNSAGQRTLLFDAVLTGAVLRRSDRGGWDAVPVWDPVMGLTFNLLTGDAATIKLTTGAPSGGAVAERIFTLTRAGVWIVAAGWGTAKAELISKGTPQTEVGWAWTDQPPRPPSQLLLVQSVPATGAAGVPVPRGATALATDLADADWSWLTDADGTGTQSVSQPQPGGGFVQRVLGARYLATVDNTATWLLEAQ